MARMLSLTPKGKWCWFADFHPRYRDGAETRQRNRAFEKATLQRERLDVPEEIHDAHRFDLCHEDGCHCWCSLDMSPWCPAVKNQVALESVGFDGTYTVGP